MDERKAYWFEQPYMPRMKNIAVAPVILEDGRLSFCVPGDDDPPWSGVWNLTGKVVLDGDDYFLHEKGAKHLSPFRGSNGRKDSNGVFKGLQRI